MAQKENLSLVMESRTTAYYFLNMAWRFKKCFHFSKFCMHYANDFAQTICTSLCNFKLHPANAAFVTEALPPQITRKSLGLGD